MCLSPVSSGYPLSSKMFLIKLISCLRLFFIHIILVSALCTSVAIRFVFRFLRAERFPVDILTRKNGLLVFTGLKQTSVFSTRMPRNGCLP